jgi:hypothetical protein
MVRRLDAADGRSMIDRAPWIWGRAAFRDLYRLRASAFGLGLNPIPAGGSHGTQGGDTIVRWAAYSGTQLGSSTAAQSIALTWLTVRRSTTMVSYKVSDWFTPDATSAGLLFWNPRIAALR